MLLCVYKVLNTLCYALSFLYVRRWMFYLSHTGRLCPHGTKDHCGHTEVSGSMRGHNESQDQCEDTMRVRINARTQWESGSMRGHNESQDQCEDTMRVRINERTQWESGSMRGHNESQRLEDTEKSCTYYCESKGHTGTKKTRHLSQGATMKGCVAA